VAARKVDGLVAAGAHITVVAPDIVAHLVDLAGEPRAHGSVRLARRCYADGEAAGYRLVLTATGIPAVDARVAADAELAGVWVNSADDFEHCTFLLPSVHREGPITVAVSTGGTSPALAVWLRHRLARVVTPEVAVMADLMGEERRRLQEKGRPTESIPWGEVLDGAFAELVAAGDVEGARALLRRMTASATASPGSGRSRTHGGDATRRRSG
jgi:siroheme synthase-like protein